MYNFHYFQGIAAFVMRGQTINRDKKYIEIPCNKTAKRHGKLYANWPLQEFCS